MPTNLNIYDDVAALERYLNLPAGGLSNIPIYARVPAVDAIKKVRDLEARTLFRPGLYYIVLVDLRKNTEFNNKYGNKEGDVRVEWFHVSVVQAIGDAQLSNYVAFSKTIGDAALLIFSSFADVVAWSSELTKIFDSLHGEYYENMEIRGINVRKMKNPERRAADFRLRARRVVHLGEVSYQQDIDPLSLAVSQTFKIEKSFDRDLIGCTQAVYDAVLPIIPSLGYKFVKNPNKVNLVGHKGPSNAYYLKPIDKK